MNSSLLSWTRNSLGKRLSLPLVLGALALVVALVYVVYATQMRSVRHQAVKQAEAVTAQMLATRAVYTQNVVGKLKADEIPVGFSPDFADSPGSIPLPATMVHLISDRVSAQGLYRINLISPWNINPKKGPVTTWEKETIAALVDDPRIARSMIETAGGKSNLLYMSADFASTEACVACHNTHPDSPRNDFKLGDMMGALVVEVPLTDEFAAARVQTAWIGLGLLVVLASFVGLVLLFQRRAVIRPVAYLTQVVQKLAQGDLAVEFEVKSEDEIGHMARALAGLVDYTQAIASVSARLAQGDLTAGVVPASEKDVLGNAFAQMISSLRHLVGQVAENAGNVNAASGQLAAAANQAGQATAQIAATIQQVAKGITQQTESVTKTAGSVEQMSRAIGGVAKGAQEQARAVAKSSNVTAQITAAIRQVASNAQSGAKGSAEAAQVARDGAVTIEANVKGMENIKAKVGQSAQKVKEMGSRSDQIGVIVETIDDIASQTNLLALNAAIEAARAGEHGKGFAVVADEVRKLAERASVATKEIGGLIKGIQKTVAEAVAAMDEGAKEVETGVGRANEAGRSLAAILKAAEAANQQMKEIAVAAQQISASSNELVGAVDSVSAVVEENTAATEEMAAGSAEVAQAIENIASVSEENSAAVEQVSAAAEEMSAQVEEVTASTELLAEMAQSLQALITQFKLQGAGAHNEAALPEAATLAVKPMSYVPAQKVLARGGNGRHY